MSISDEEDNFTATALYRSIFYDVFGAEVDFVDIPKGSPNLESIFFEVKVMRLGVIAIVVDDTSVAMSVQEALGKSSNIIVARTGVPDREHNVSVISVIVRGTVEEISALTGRLGRISHVTVKSAITNAKEEQV